MYTSFMKLLDWFGVINGSLHVSHIVLHNIFKMQIDGCFLRIFFFLKWHRQLTVKLRNTNTDFLTAWCDLMMSSQLYCRHMFIV